MNNNDYEIIPDVLSQHCGFPPMLRNKKTGEVFMDVKV